MEKMKYLKKEDAEKLNLPFKRNDVRQDGYIFMYYYTRGDINKVYEMWNSPKTISKLSVYKKKAKKKYHLKTKKYIKRVKLYLGCQICGYKKCSDALQFDHINVTTKVRDISTMRSCGFSRLKEEMRKCRVLCANCHAEHTNYQRRKGLFNNETNT